MSRKHESLDVVKMYSTLTRDHWRSCLIRAVQKGNVDKLVGWRYGLQAGLAEANHRGVSSIEIDKWVMKRVRDLEKAMKIILRKKYPNPLDEVSKTNAGARLDYIHKAKTLKAKRDREFEDFLRKSAF